MEGIPLLIEKAGADGRHTEAFMQVMVMPGGSREAVAELMKRFQLDVCLGAMQRARLQAAQKRRMLGLVGPNAGPTRAEQYTIRDLLTFQQDPLPTSLLRLERSLLEPAKQLFGELLAFMELEEGRVLNREDERLLVSRVLALLGLHPPLRDEACMQLQKQTRNNPYRASCAKAWHLFRICVTVFPPSVEVAGPLSQYFEALTADAKGLEPELRDQVLATWAALDRALKTGPRRVVPSSDEVAALMNRKALVVPVYLSDDSPENIPYDVTTTLTDVMQAVLKKLQVVDDQCFGLYTWRVTKLAGATPGEPVTDHILLDLNQYVGDVLAEYVKHARGGLVASKLLLKRRFFLKTDVATPSRMLLQLCYIQLRHDYCSSYYLVTEEGAVMLSALQILAEIGNVPDAETSLEWAIQMKKSIPRVMWRFKTKEQWMALVVEKYKSLWALDYEGTMREFVSILLGLPSGGSSFFYLKTLVDSAEYFPNSMVLGINNKGLHFLDAEVRSVIHMVELKEVSEYAGRPDRVFFSMILKDQLHNFEFSTTGGDEVCLILDHYITRILKDLNFL